MHLFYYHSQIKFATFMFLHVSVILSTGRGSAILACIAGGIPACLAAGLRGVGGIPAWVAGFQAHTQWGSWGGSGRGGSPGPLLRGSWGGSGLGGSPGPHLGGWSPGPHPGGLLPGGCGDPPPVMAIAAGITRPGMHSCSYIGFQKVSTWR